MRKKTTLVLTVQTKKTTLDAQNKTSKGPYNADKKCMKNVTFNDYKKDGM